MKKRSILTSALSASATSLALPVLLCNCMTPSASNAPRQSKVRQMGGTNDAGYKEFQSVGLNYCDAEVLGQFWKTTPDAAKISFGQKARQNGMDNAKAVLTSARHQAGILPDSQNPCQYTDTGYTYEDAQLLSTFWHLDIGGAKSKIAERLRDGTDITTQSELQGARQKH